MALLFVAAEASELVLFANRLTGLRALKWPLDYAQEGILEGRRVLLAANGAGPKLASQAVEIAIRAISAADLQSSVLEGVVSVGLCGGLDPELQEGAVVVASEVRVVDAGEIFHSSPVESELPFAIGVVASQDRIACSAAEKIRLHNSCGAVAVEMEAFGVAARAKRAGLPFCCIKVVSDRADESFGVDFNLTRTLDGHISRGKIILRSLARPVVIPELFRLKRRADMASGVLGDFLVSCRFNIQSAGFAVPEDDSSNAAG